jgi:transposase
VRYKQKPVALRQFAKKRSTFLCNDCGFLKYAQFCHFQAIDRNDASVPPDQEVHIVMDNYGTHKTPLIRAWFAKRARFHVHFTPTYGSCLNQVERLVRGTHDETDSTSHPSQRERTGAVREARRCARCVARWRHEWMEQQARNVTMEDSGFLINRRSCGQKTRRGPSPPEQSRFQCGRLRVECGPIVRRGSGRSRGGR